MEVKAKLLGPVTKDYITKKYRLTFEVEGNVINALDSITGKTLRLTVVQWRERRSLDSNGYMWKLTEKIAEEQAKQQFIPVTKDEVHKRHVIQYGYAALKNDGAVREMFLKDVDDIDSYPGYWRRAGNDPASGLPRFVQLKGTSDYDTKEMSTFLMFVIEEAKELGIETATPDELKRMEQLYEEYKKRTCK